jgi:hypothetical protein
VTQRSLISDRLPTIKWREEAKRTCQITHVDQFFQGFRGRTRAVEPQNKPDGSDEMIGRGNPTNEGVKRANGDLLPSEKS